jgi:hypothetical protein
LGELGRAFDVERQAHLLHSTTVETTMTSLLDLISERIKDHRHATSTGAPPQVYPPVTLEALEAAEAKLGFRLPGLILNLREPSRMN